MKKLITIVGLVAVFMTANRAEAQNVYVLQNGDVAPNLVTNKRHTTENGDHP